ncbi:MAG TPA: formate dehydrogenase accessory sulfurtransferase FdhD [Opitutaceae bacterium]|jgi:FdhD protein|nr:formate dehydrogenase accessory sulfurtransferase FdhD [Opitutaceae bacterium]
MSSGDGPIRESPSLRWSAGGGLGSRRDQLIAEEPLAIEIAFERQGQSVVRVWGITMRTPGHDEELALGLLHAEGLIAGWDDVRESGPREVNARGEKVATWRVTLARAPRDEGRVLREGLAGAGCGLCGRPTLEGLPLGDQPLAGLPPLSCERLAELPELLRRHQPAFAATGGCHGAALCGADGSLRLAREDVGRHNAVDKAVGAALRRGLDFSGLILVLSGRAGFELVQKAAAAGLPAVIAVGAPSSAAVELAHGAGLTLIGFARPGRFNVYTHAGRLDLADARFRLAEA